MTRTRTALTCPPWAHAPVHSLSSSHLFSRCVGTPGVPCRTPYPHASPLYDIPAIDLVYNLSSCIGHCSRSRPRSEYCLTRSHSSPVLC
ncbi:hypothetical protein K523DRAFT_31579 [Schizophyllum commune Tattone D]|nr:hypothetical protein K523DRAFT_31579 [Schizophyllum commune Tattone D]